MLLLHHSHTAARSLLPGVQTLTVTLRPATANRHCSSISVFQSGLGAGQSPEKRDAIILSNVLITQRDTTTVSHYRACHTRLATQTKCSRLIFTNDLTAKRENLEAALLYITSIFLAVHIGSEI